jgi:hypothetical protein
MGMFDAESIGYDYDRAKSVGMGPTGDGTKENKGHWGSVAPTTEEERKKYNLPRESYILLKGKKHESWDKAIQGEVARGFKVIKKGNRYFSVPSNPRSNRLLMQDAEIGE